jgi:hypothetical protein
MLAVIQYSVAQEIQLDGNNLTKGMKESHLYRPIEIESSKHHAIILKISNNEEGFRGTYTNKTFKTHT